MYNIYSQKSCQDLVNAPLHTGEDNGSLLRTKYRGFDYIWGSSRITLLWLTAPLVREVAAAVDLRICFCIDQPHLKSFDHVNCV